MCQGRTRPFSESLRLSHVLQIYDFNILAVRYNGSADARITRFSVEGITESGIIEIKQGMKSWTGENLDNYVAAFHDVIPSADGKVILSVEGLDTGAAADGNINAVVISR